MCTFSRHAIISVDHDCLLINYSEDYWMVMSRLEKKSTYYVYDDQARLNFGLLQMNPDWGKSKALNIRDHHKVGTTSNGFKVTVLSGKEACRQDCSQAVQRSVYIWHGYSPGSKERQTANAEKARLWFLKKDWETYNGTATGENWLKVISNL